MDRRQRVEQALPPLATVAPDPELAGGGTKVERGGLKLIDVHRVAQNGKVALLLREPARQPVPRIAGVLAAPNSGRAAGTGARLRRKRHYIKRVRVFRVDKNREAEVGRKSLADRAPGAPVVVAAQHADV